jgi:hypothetical protein
MDRLTFRINRISKIVDSAGVNLHALSLLSAQFHRGRWRGQSIATAGSGKFPQRKQRALSLACAIGS